MLEEPLSLYPLRDVRCENISINLKIKFKDFIKGLSIILVNQKFQGHILNLTSSFPPESCMKM